MKKRQLVTLDFETFYDKEYSLRKLTMEDYIRHDLFEVIGVSVKIDDGPTQWFSGGHNATQTFLDQFDWSNSMLLAHNTAFDGAILNWRFGIRPYALADTMSMANAVGDGAGSVSLAALSEKYQLGTKGTEVLNALGKRRLDFTPDELAAYGEYCSNDVDLCYLLFQLMLARGFPTQELKLVDLTLRMFTEPVLELDLSLLEGHLEDLRIKKQELLNNISCSKEDLMSNPKFAEVLRSMGIDPPMKISPATGRETYAFAKTDEAFKALPEQYPEDTPMRFVVEALVAARTGLKSTLEETRTERFIAIAKRGKLSVPIKYSGTKTKRWSGEGGGINMQNLPKKSPLKKAIRAPKDHYVIGADLSNIELRVGLWFGGMANKLKLIAGGVDLYRDFIAPVFDVPYAQVNPDQRFIGKTSQLSLIYGVGAKKLRQAIITGSMMYLQKKIDIGDAEADRIVKLYRNEYHGIVDAWYEGDRVLEAILNDRYMEYGPGGVVQVHGSKGILLPSGLYMSYPGLHKMQADGRTQWRYKSRKGWEYIYGAKVFQQTIQALARCIMGDGMLRIRKVLPECPIALTVHDAAYPIAHKTRAQEVLDTVIRLLCVPPDWGRDIPLAAEGGFGETLKDC